MRAIIAALILLVSTMSAYAEPRSFNAAALYSLCNPGKNDSARDRETANTTCGAYMLGLTDGMFMMQEMADHSMTPCLPKASPVDVAEARQLFNDYLARHIEAATNSAGLVMGMALASAYPCPTSK